MDKILFSLMYTTCLLDILREAFESTQTTDLAHWHHLPEQSPPTGVSENG